MSNAVATTTPPLEAAPLADARRAVACAATAIAAAVHLRPDLGQRLGLIHAQLVDIRADLDRVTP